MAARRNRIAPYEIMTRTGQDVAENDPVETWGDEPSGTSPMNTVGQWWAATGVGEPWILRLPRGVAVLVGLAILVLIVLGYWVGYSRGLAARPVDELNMVGPDRSHRIPQITTSTGGISAGQTSPPAPATPDLPAVRSDPRVAGLNYLILARYPETDAQKLAEFLATLGVETVLDPVDNGRSVHVVAVDRGFTSLEVRSNSDTLQSYERQMRAHGRAWKRHNNNRGDALETMYLGKYEGP
jgi:hypothetical protein